MSALFNNAQYNEILYGASSPTEGPLYTYDTMSVTINGSSNVEGSISGESISLGSTITCTSDLPFIRLDVVLGFSPLIISGGSSVTSELCKAHGISTVIEGTSLAKAGTFLVYISSLFSTVVSEITVDYVFDDAIFSGNSQVTPRLTFETTLEGIISASSAVTSNISIEKVFETADISGNSIVSATTLDIFKKLETSITSIAEVNAIELSSTTRMSVSISGSSQVSYAYVSKNLAGFGETLISGSSDFKSTKKLEGVNILGGKSRISATIEAPISLTSIGNRRRVSYIFEVERPNTNVSLIDEHYKIFRFYNSLASLGPSLDYVRRNSEKEIASYDVDSTSHRQWNSAQDLLSIRTGDRGIVQAGATDIFAGKDGFFALYKGPNVGI